MNIKKYMSNIGITENGNTNQGFQVETWRNGKKTLYRFNVYFEFCGTDTINNARAQLQRVKMLTNYCRRNGYNIRLSDIFGYTRYYIVTPRAR